MTAANRCGSSSIEELVLTGCDDFWPADAGQAVFLGPWCFSGRTGVHFWDQRRYRIAPSPWTSHEKVLQAARYVDGLTDRLLPLIAEYLNQYQETPKSVKFWKVYLSPWLPSFLGVCFDRFVHLENSCVGLEAGSKRTVRVLKSGTSYVVERLEDYPRSVLFHDFNLHLFSDLIRIAEFPHLDPKEADGPSIARSASAMRLAPPINDRRLMDRIRSHIAERLNGAARVVVDSSFGLSPSDRIRMQIAVDPWLFLRRGSRLQLVRAYPTATDLGALPKFSPHDVFENAVKYLLLKYLPKSYLIAWHVEEKCRAWVGTVGHGSSELARRVAQITENGGKWIAVQHGGGYGQFLSFPLGKAEYDSSDAFVSWGWTEEHIYPCRIHPLPSPKLSKLPSHRPTSSEILLVSTAHATYLYRLHSTLYPQQQLQYLENKRLFYEALHPALQRRLRYRPALEDYGQNDLGYVSTFLPRDQILSGGSLIDRMAGCSLMVADHNATSYLEALASNVPLVLFWDPAHFAVTARTQRFFDEFRLLGVLHDSPQSAAAMVNSIGDHPREWWQQPQIQELRRRFCREFARTSSTWRSEWLAFLRTLERETTTDRYKTLGSKNATDSVPHRWMA